MILWCYSAPWFWGIRRNEKAPHVDTFGMRGASVEKQTRRLIAQGMMTIRLPWTSVRFQARSTSLSGTRSIAALSLPSLIQSHT